MKRKTISHRKPESAKQRIKRLITTPFVNHNTLQTFISNSSQMGRYCSPGFYAAFSALEPAENCTQCLYQDSILEYNQIAGIAQNKTGLPTDLDIPLRSIDPGPFGAQPGTNYSSEAYPSSLNSKFTLRSFQKTYNWVNQNNFPVCIQMYEITPRHPTTANFTANISTSPPPSAGLQQPAFPITYVIPNNPIANWYAGVMEDQWNQLVNQANTNPSTTAYYNNQASISANVDQRNTFQFPTRKGASVFKCTRFGRFFKVTGSKSIMVGAGKSGMMGVSYAINRTIGQDTINDLSPQVPAPISADGTSKTPYMFPGLGKFVVFVITNADFVANRTDNTAPPIVNPQINISCLQKERFEWFYNKPDYHLTTNSLVSLPKVGTGLMVAPATLNWVVTESQPYGPTPFRVQAPANQGIRSNIRALNSTQEWDPVGISPLLVGGGKALAVAPYGTATAAVDDPPLPLNTTDTNIDSSMQFAPSTGQPYICSAIPGGMIDSVLVHGFDALTSTNVAINVDQTTGTAGLQTHNV